MIKGQAGFDTYGHRLGINTDFQKSLGLKTVWVKRFHGRMICCSESDAVKGYIFSIISVVF